MSHRKIKEKSERVTEMDGPVIWRPIFQKHFEIINKENSKEIECLGKKDETKVLG